MTIDFHVIKEYERLEKAIPPAFKTKGGSDYQIEPPLNPKGAIK